MERAPARSCLAAGAVAAAMTAAAIGAIATQPGNPAADMAPVAARLVLPAGTAMAPAAGDDHGHATPDPIVVDDPHEGTGDQPSTGPAPMDDMDMGHDGDPGASPVPSGDHQASDTPGDDPHGDDPNASDTPGDDPHGDDPHGDAVAGARPRELVLGGFGLINGLALAGAAFLRRRDRDAAARRAAKTSAPAIRRDAAR